MGILTIAAGVFLGYLSSYTVLVIVGLLCKYFAYKKAVNKMSDDLTDLLAKLDQDSYTNSSTKH